jgi:hypothetical protein
MNVRNVVTGHHACGASAFLGRATPAFGANDTVAQNGTRHVGPARLACGAAHSGIRPAQ